VTAETVYDEQIAPLLLQAAKLCHEHGMPFVAQVEYQPGDFGMTADLPAREQRSLPMDWMYVAGNCRGNADSMIGHLVDGARERGHTSVYLSMLGIPATYPEATDHDR
jgi:hypothetical protein